MQIYLYNPNSNTYQHITNNPQLAAKLATKHNTITLITNNFNVITAFNPQGKQITLKQVKILELLLTN